MPGGVINVCTWLKSLYYECGTVKFVYKILVSFYGSHYVQDIYNVSN